MAEAQAEGRRVRRSSAGWRCWRASPAPIVRSARRSGSPPLGLNLFVLSGLTGESVLNIARKAVPYVLSMLVVVLLLAFVPALSLWAL